MLHVQQDRRQATEDLEFLQNQFLLQWVHGLLSSTYLLHHFAHDTMYSPLHLSWCKLLSFGKVCQDQSIPPKRSAVRVISVVVHQIVDHVLSPDFLFSVGRMGFLLTLRFNTRLLPSKKLKYIDNVVRHIGIVNFSIPWGFVELSPRLRRCLEYFYNYWRVANYRLSTKETFQRSQVANIYLTTSTLQYLQARFYPVPLLGIAWVVRELRFIDLEREMDYVLSFNILAKTEDWYVDKLYTPFQALLPAKFSEDVVLGYGQTHQAAWQSLQRVAKGYSPKPFVMFVREIFAAAATIKSEADDHYRRADFEQAAANYIGVRLFLQRAMEAHKINAQDIISVFGATYYEIFVILDINAMFAAIWDGAYCLVTRHRIPLHAYELCGVQYHHYLRLRTFLLRTAMLGTIIGACLCGNETHEQPPGLGLELGLALDGYNTDRSHWESLVVIAKISATPRQLPSDARAPWGARLRQASIASSSDGQVSTSPVSRRLSAEGDTGGDSRDEEDITAVVHAERSRQSSCTRGFKRKVRGCHDENLAIACKKRA